MRTVRHLAAIRVLNSNQFQDGRLGMSRQTKSDMQKTQGNPSVGSEGHRCERKRNNKQFRYEGGQNIVCGVRTLISSKMK